MSNSTKAHIAALSLLDRALINTSDDELTALLAGLPADHLTAVQRIAGVRADDDASVDEAIDDDAIDDGEAEGDTEPAATTPNEIDADLVPAIREAAHRGRLNGDLQRLGVVLTDVCLADCVEALGDSADLPSTDDLKGVIPDLVAKHGVGPVRLMLAATVVGEAPASATIIDLLKNDDDVKLPPLDLKPLAPLLPPKADDAERQALRQQRKDRKAAEQAAAKARREQIARAKNRV